MPDSVDAFISRWSEIQGPGGERANFQSFARDLVNVLDLPRPEPASDDTRDNAYVFERRVRIKGRDGSESYGFIDLYKRGAFVCEAKQTGKEIESAAWDTAMGRAHRQAERYARALPADEGRPPFIIVVDVGKSLEIYSEFSRSGATYTPFPDASTHRILLEDLRNEEVQDRLKRIWLDPLSLDPSRKSARVTREIATSLAKLAKSLEIQGHDPESVAAFLMRTMFAMFAEDVGLIRERSFTELLEGLTGERIRTFVPMMEGLFRDMNEGGFSTTLRDDILRFNGGLFAEARAIAVDRDQLDLLIEAAHADWRFVEPAIFGTLLERALDPRERHKLGAHYTPRAYVERLVLPTVIEPLREEFQNAQVEALTYERQGKTKEAQAAMLAFHRRLSSVRVLDPACGSANFLYVTLEHMKRLEGEVLNILHDLGVSQAALELEGESFTVTPDQFLGIEINPRAAKIAEMVLWIGYLQWHFRTHGASMPAEPILRDFKNIENRDALIEYDAEELLVDASGQPITRWDGVTMKTSPITGELIPDESAQRVQYVYKNPRKAVWPEADFIIGNPPFIGTKRMRSVLGDGYVDALRETWTELKESCDFVMYWWHHAAELTRTKKIERFGLITTNSITHSFNRTAVMNQISASPPLFLKFAISDHPWVDSAEGAAVRIAMTVGDSVEGPGVLASLQHVQRDESPDVPTALHRRTGFINDALRVGAHVSGSHTLQSNSGISGMGVALHGRGFILDPAEASELRNSGENVIRKYIGGRDLVQVPRERYLIDFFGLSSEEARASNPAAWQRIFDRVKPERDLNRRASIRENWWKFGWDRPLLRKALEGVSDYIGTTETAKHRVFTSISSDVLSDHMVICFALTPAPFLGILSSRLHVAWALAAGGRLGVGNDPRYNKTRCFETFPFPVLTPEQEAKIGALAEQIDAHRKRQQAKHEKLTLTNIYNVLEKLRSGEALTPKERETHEQGLVSVLRELHDALDRAVFEAYGWSDLGEILVGLPGATTPLLDKSDEQAEAEEELLRRLVDLNAERAAEEERGLIRWLRPEFQAPAESPSVEQKSIDGLEAKAKEAPKKTTAKLTWPKTIAAQINAVREVLKDGGEANAEAIAQRFRRKPVQAVREVLEALEVLGVAGL